MAELTMSSNHQNRGGIRSKKLSTRVDLTPMVDLGFLLITFFIFTTTLKQAHVMRLIVPSDEPVANPPKAADSKTVSFILGDNNVIYYYYGVNSGQMLHTDYSAAGLRSVIQEKMKALQVRYGSSGELIALIKPTSQANYKNLVDILDEMTINEVKKYMLVDPEEQELKSAGIKI